MFHSLGLVNTDEVANFFPSFTRQEILSTNQFIYNEKRYLPTVVLSVYKDNETDLIVVRNNLKRHVRSSSGLDHTRYLVLFFMKNKRA